MKIVTKIVLSAMAALFLIVGSLAFLVFSNSGYKLMSKPSVQVFDSIIDAKTYGKTLELKEEELNSILAVLVKSEITKGNFSIYGIEAKLQSSHITFFSPASYKGIKFLLTTSGSFKENGDSIIFKPSYIKVGKISLPVGVFMSKAKDIRVSLFKIADNAFTLDKSALPFSIKSFKVTDKSVILEFKGVTNSQIINSSGVTDNSQNRMDEGSKDNLKTINVSKPKAVEAALNNDSLRKLSSQLSLAIGILSNDSEKNILHRVKASVDKKIANPSYNINKDVSEVKVSYSKLMPEERNHIKSAILSKVDIQNAMDLKEIFGL